MFTQADTIRRCVVCVPRVALNMVTAAALVAQSAEALRGLNYDKQELAKAFLVEPAT